MARQASDSLVVVVTPNPAAAATGREEAASPPGGREQDQLQDEQAAAPAAPAQSLSERVAARREAVTAQLQRQRSTDPGAGAPHGASAQQEDDEETCRICLGTENLDGQAEALLDHQCACTGSVDRVHLTCLTSWVVERRSLVCELCKSTYKEPTLSHLKAALIQHPPRSHHHQQGDPLGVLTMGGDNGDAARDSVMSWQNIMCHVVVLVVLLAVILYLTVFSSIAPSASASDWTSILWRVLTILIPAYLVIRMSAAVWTRYRQERAVRQQQQLEQQQQQQQAETRGAMTEVVDLELGGVGEPQPQRAQHEPGHEGQAQHEAEGDGQQLPTRSQAPATSTSLAGSHAAAPAAPALPQTPVASEPVAVLTGQGTSGQAAAVATASEGVDQQGSRRSDVPGPGRGGV